MTKDKQHLVWASDYVAAGDSGALSFYYFCCSDSFTYSTKVKLTKTKSKHCSKNEVFLKKMNHVRASSLQVRIKKIREQQ